MTVFDYESIAIIGRGAFGEVRVCRNLVNKKIVAIKKLYKDEMHKKNQIVHVRTEKEFLQSIQHPFIVNLLSSFQDTKHLYLEMEFLVGGDLMSQLIKKDIFTEYEAKFYTAQIISAIEYVHFKGCIHRDIKPDNILIDKDGFIKLSDFGLSKVLNQDIYKTYAINDTIIVEEEQKDLKNMSKLKRKRIVRFILLACPFYCWNSRLYCP